MPFMRSESCSFIWHPKVVTWYRGIADGVGLDDHADLAAGLHRVDLVDAVVARGDLLELAQALDVLLQRLAARAGTGTAERVRGLHDHGFDRLRLDLVVMCLHRVRH